MKLINGRNYFNEEDFSRMCEELEKGTHIEVYIDCIGHARNANEQLAYREAITKKYGDRIEVNGSSHYGFNYKLKTIPKIICQLKEMSFAEIKFEMEDEHALYFNAIDETDKGLEKEIKAVKEDMWAYCRDKGKEDWAIADMVEL